MNNYFYTNKNDRSRWFRVIDGIVANDADMFFNALYMAITNHPTYVIQSDLEDDRKNTILGAMLKHFEDKEEFEKCAAINKIKKQIKIVC
jgi:hypothetical protein